MAMAGAAAAAAPPAVGARAWRPWLLALIAAGMLLTAAGADVRSWISDAVTPSQARAGARARRCPAAGGS